MNPRSLLSATFFALITILSSTAKTHRHWEEAVSLADSTATWRVPEGTGHFTIEICASMKGLKDSHGLNRQAWSVALVSDSVCTGLVTVGWGNTDFGAIDDRRYLYVAINDSITGTFDTGVNVYGGDNTLVIDGDSDGEVHVSVGSDYLRHAGTFRLSHPFDTVTLTSYGNLSVALMAIECAIDESLDTGYTLDDINRLALPADRHPTGMWHYLDRDNNPDYARPGGTYTLAVLPDDKQGDYIIIYVGGAVVNSPGWHTGMIKGRLEATPFAGRYRLKWWDAKLRPVYGECNALLEDGVMTLNFPLLDTQLRFCR